MLRRGRTSELEADSSLAGLGVEWENRPFLEGLAVVTVTVGTSVGANVVDTADSQDSGDDRGGASCRRTRRIGCLGGYLSILELSISRSSVYLTPAAVLLRCPAGFDLRPRSHVDSPSSPVSLFCREEARHCHCIFQTHMSGPPS